MALVNKNLLRAVKRLRKDYDDILRSSAELPFVAAVPVAIIKDNSNDSSMKNWLKWRITIMAPPSSRFAGILLSLTLNFPENYPENGPRCELANGVQFRHEHVYGNWVCLSILNDFIPCWGETVDRGEGWSYGYSVASILVQLQSFLFDEDPVDGASLHDRDISETFRACINYKDNFSGHSYFNPCPRPAAWQLPEYLVDLGDTCIDRLKEYFRGNSSFYTDSQVNSSSRITQKAKPKSQKKQGSTGKASSVSTTTSNMIVDTFKEEGESQQVDTFFRPSNSCIECVVTSISESTGAQLQSIDCQQKQQQLYLPKSEVMEVRWKGQEMKMELAFKAGDKINVHNFVHRRDNSRNSNNLVSLRPPRTYTLPREKQTQVIKNASNLMHAYVHPGTSTVIKLLPNGLLIALGSLFTSSTFLPSSSSSLSSASSSESDSEMIAKSGLVAFLPHEHFPAGCLKSSSQLANVVGKTVHGKGLWVVHTNASKGQLEVSSLDPNYFFQNNINTLRCLSNHNPRFEVKGVKLYGRVKKVVPCSSVDDSVEEYALIQFSMDTSVAFGKLRLSTVQEQFKKNFKNHAHIWELKQIGLESKKEVQIQVVSDKVCKKDSTVDVSLFFATKDSEKNANMQQQLQVAQVNKKKSMSETVGNTQKKTTNLMSLTNYLLLDILSYLSRGELAVLSGGGACFSYGKNGGMRLNQQSKGGETSPFSTPLASANLPLVVHPRLCTLADTSTTQRNCLNDFSCVFLRESFTSKIIGVGVNIKTHQDRHEAEKIMRRQNTTFNSVLYDMVDFDGEPLYDDYYEEEEANRRAYTLNAWFTSKYDVVVKAREWAAEQRAVAALNNDSNELRAPEPMKQRLSLLERPKSDVEEVKVFWGCGYFSYEAYHLHNIKSTPMHAPCTGWLPLWINHRHGRKSTCHALKASVKALYGEDSPLLLQDTSLSLLEGQQSVVTNALIESGDQLSLVLDAFVTFVLKAMNTTVVGMLSGAAHDSEAALEGYFALYQLLINVSNLYPGLLDVLKSRVVQFVTDPDMRSKKVCPSLGELLPLLPLCGLQWSDVVIPVVTEAFTRNARWAIKACPQLADISQETVGVSGDLISEDGLTDKERFRLSNTLEANAVSLRLIAFHCVVADLVISDVGADVPKQISKLDLALGKPSSKAIDQLKYRTRNLKSLTSWGYFFDAIKLSRPSHSYLVQWLRRSIELSSAKRYHSQYKSMALLKQKKRENDQMKEHLAKQSQMQKGNSMLKYENLLGDFGV